MFKWKKYDTRDILDDIYENQELLNNKTDNLEFININVFDIIDENNIEEDELYSLYDIFGDIITLVLMLKASKLNYYNLKNIIEKIKQSISPVWNNQATSIIKEDIKKRFNIK